MLRSAAMPLNDAPYPTEVGTAITGTETSPPTTLASAPSIPATATTQFAARIPSAWSIWSSSLWRPATPTS